MPLSAIRDIYIGKQVRSWALAMLQFLRLASLLRSFALAFRSLHAAAMGSAHLHSLLPPHPRFEPCVSDCAVLDPRRLHASWRVSLSLRVQTRVFESTQLGAQAEEDRCFSIIGDSWPGFWGTFAA